MSILEIKSFSPTSDLIVNSINCMNLTSQNFNVDLITAQNINVPNIQSNGNQNLANVTAYDISLTSHFPDIIRYKGSTTYTAQTNLLTMTSILQGIIIGNYTTSAFDVTFDTAQNMYNAYPMLPGQVLELMFINISGTQNMVFGTSDSSNVLFNGFPYNPILYPNGTGSKIVYYQFIGTSSLPKYIIWG